MKDGLHKQYFPDNDNLIAILCKMGRLTRKILLASNCSSLKKYTANSDDYEEK